MTRDEINRIENLKAACRAFDQINDATGFANGNKFTTDEQVREYFKADELNRMFQLRGEDEAFTQASCDEMADTVIEFRLHYETVDPRFEDAE